MNKASSGDDNGKDDILDMMGSDDRTNIREMIAQFARGGADGDGSQSPSKNVNDIMTIASSQSVSECVICGYEVDGEVILPCYHTA